MKDKGILADLFESIQYCMDSKKGKFSLDTYLDIIGEYADKQILAAQKEGLVYRGGQCAVKKATATSESYIFEVNLYFETETGEQVKKEAKRELPIDKFVREMQMQIGTETKVFQIYAPEVEK